MRPLFARDIPLNTKHLRTRYGQPLIALLPRAGWPRNRQKPQPLLPAPLEVQWGRRPKTSSRAAPVPSGRMHLHLPHQPVLHLLPNVHQSSPQSHGYKPLCQLYVTSKFVPSPTCLCIRWWYAGACRHPSRFRLQWNHSWRSLFLSPLHRSCDDPCLWPPQFKAMQQWPWELHRLPQAKRGLQVHIMRVVLCLY
jgi:hypothetical protein